MMSQRWVLVLLAMLSLCIASSAAAQSPSALYTWGGTGDVRGWVGPTGSPTLSNTVAGELTIAETTATGTTFTVRDDFNRIRELTSDGSGGLDLTGLDFLEFDLGHNGAGNVNVQFFVQATTGSTFVALAPDVAVTPGINTYQLPITQLTAAQAVYVRTVGFIARDHVGLGPLAWNLQEVRSGGIPLAVRDLITHNVGTPEGGLQSAIVNFDGAAVLGNTGQNQTGLSHNPSGTGSLQWTDLGDHGVSDPSGGAITWGNGTAWNGNSFNSRLTDLSNYDTMKVRISATDPSGGGGSVGMRAFFQRGSGFTFQEVPAPYASLPIDGQFHELEFDLTGQTLMHAVDWTGLDLFAHANDLVINVDRIRFVPEPTTAVLFGIAGVFGLGFSRRAVRRQR